MRSRGEELIKLGDEICVLRRQNARLNDEVAGLNRKLANLQQEIGDLIHKVGHHKYIADHAAKLLEDERHDKSEEKVK